MDDSYLEVWGLIYIAICWLLMGSSRVSCTAHLLTFLESPFFLTSKFVCRYLGGLFFLMYRLPFHESIMYGALISATDPVSVLAIFQVLIYLLSQFCIDRCSLVLFPNHYRFWVVMHGRHNQIAPGYRTLSYEGTLACMQMPAEKLILWCFFDVMRELLCAHCLMSTCMCVSLLNFHLWQS